MSIKIIVEGGSIAEILAALSGSITHRIHVTETPTIADDDEGDDTGPVNTAAPAVDKDGVPWDARIHSDNKQLTGKGIWRKRKNLDGGYYNAITAELKARGATSVPAPPAYTPPPGVPMLPAGAIAQPVFTAAPSTPAPPPPSLPPQPQAPVQSVGMSFGELMSRVSPAIAAGKITQQTLDTIFNWQQITGLEQLATDPAKTLAVFNWLNDNNLL